MKTRTTQRLTVLVIVVLALGLYAGNVLAQDGSPNTTAPTNMLQRMQERLGPEAWAQHLQQMTQTHGAAFVSQMMAHMAQQENGPCMNGGEAGPGMGMRQGTMGREMQGPGMMQQQQKGTQQGMMSRGAQGQGQQWGRHQPMGLRFWNSTPEDTTTPPTP